MADDNVKAVAQAGAVVPIHSKTIKPKNPPGRPKKVEKAPSKEDLAYHAVMVEARERFVSNHPVVKQNPEPRGTSAVDKLNLVKSQIAREVAVLTFNRLEQEKRGIDTSQVSSRIVAALSKISDIELEVKKLGHTVIDPHSTAVQNILKLWLDALTQSTQELAREGSLSAQTLDLLFSKFSDKMEGWEDRVEEG